MLVVATCEYKFTPLNLDVERITQFNSVSTTLIKLTHLITEFSSQDDDEYIKPMMKILNFKV